MSEDYEALFRFRGCTINGVMINVSGEHYVDLEKEAQAMFSRE